MTAIWRLRAAVLTLVGALVLHQLRYALVPQEHDHELGGVHAYLSWLMPAAAALLFLIVVQLLVWLRRAEGACHPEIPSGRALWITASASLLAVFGAQEAIELTVVHGQVPAFLELAHHLGWQVGLFSVVLGAVLALLLRGAARVVDWALRRRRPPRRRLQVEPLFSSRDLVAWRGSVVARHLASRAPPLSA